MSNQTNNTVETGTLVRLNGLTGVVTGQNRGWFHVELADGATKNARLAALEVVDPSTDGQSSRSMSKLLSQHRPSYKLGLTAGGRKSLNNGDAVAVALDTLDADDVCSLADQLLGAPDGWSSHADKWAHLNRGHRRMCAGNKLRAAVKRGDLALEVLQDRTGNRPS